MKWMGQLWLQWWLFLSGDGKIFPHPAPARAHAAGFFAGKTGKVFRGSEDQEIRMQSTGRLPADTGNQGIGKS
jgi:hypothetical protein